MAKNEKFNEEDGVWRTIGGRRVFIRNGQSLSEAMIESGKFKNLRSEYRKAKEEEKKKEKQEWDKSDEDMLKSIYAYSNEEKNVEEDSYYKDLVDKYGEEDVKNKFKDLQEKYDIETNTYTDSEGVTYNTLKEKKDKSDDEYALYKKAKENESSIDPMTENSTDWEALDEKYKDRYDKENNNKDIRIENKNGELTGYTKGERIEYAHSGSTGLMANVYSIDDGKLSGQQFEIPKEYQGDKLEDYSLKEIERLKSDKEAYETRQKEGLDKFIQKSTNPFYPDNEYSKEDLDRMAENGIKPMDNSYSGRGWEGVNSDKNLSTKEQAKAITNAMKKKYPDVKISRKSELYSGGSSIHLDIMSSDKDLYVSDADIDKMSLQDLSDVTRSNNFNWWAKENVPGYEENRAMYSEKDVKNYAKERLAQMKKGDNQSVRGNEWYLSDYGKKVVSDLNKEANSYTYDDSDGMTDYFNHGTYMWVNIGKYDKPYQVNQKSTNETMNNAIREKASKKTNSQFEVSDLKAKALASLPKEHIDTHGSDLYIKKTKESDALLENMKNKNSGLLTTFKDQQTGETWYDVPFGNMGDDFKEKSSGNQISNSLREKAYKKYLKEHPGSKISFEQFKNEK